MTDERECIEIEGQLYAIDRSERVEPSPEDLRGWAEKARAYEESTKALTKYAEALLIDSAKALTKRAETLLADSEFSSRTAQEHRRRHKACVQALACLTQGWRLVPLGNGESGAPEELSCGS
jgi:hypothetical protein